MRLFATYLAFVFTFALTGCRGGQPAPESKLKPPPRHGDEIVAAGRFFRTGAPVVLWTDPGGYRQYDLTPQQYDSLIKLTAALGTAFPRITIDYPKDTGGQLIATVLTDAQWQAYTGVLGHYHVQRNKQDPGPAFQWERVIREARQRMSPDAVKANDAMRGKASK